MGRYADTYIPATRAVVNAFSSGSPACVASVNAAQAKKTLSGALTAATLATIVSITGPGWIDYLAVASEDTSSRTLRLQVILDGVTVFDTTSAATTTASAGMFCVGRSNLTADGGSAGPLRFNATCVIKVASSNTETDKVSTYHIARTE